MLKHFGTLRLVERFQKRPEKRKRPLYGQVDVLKLASFICKDPEAKLLLETWVFGRLVQFKRWVMYGTKKTIKLRSSLFWADAFVAVSVVNRAQPATACQRPRFYGRPQV